MAVELKIFYEDNHILVVEKPEGVLSQGDETNDESMLDMVKKYIKIKYQKPGNVYVGLVHRLDRRVSGVMVFAKSTKAAKRICTAMQNNKVKKRYYAIVVGKLEGHGKLVNRLEKVRNCAVESENGKECILEYDVIKHFQLDGNDFSVLDVNLITGRYNQIRKQLSLINHPIVNDYKYGYRGPNYFNQLGLKCYLLSFLHPTKKEILTFESGFDNSWKDIIKLGE